MLEDIHLAAIQRKVIQKLSVTQMLLVTLIGCFLYHILIKLKGLVRVYQLSCTMAGPKAYPFIGNILSICEFKKVAVFKSKANKILADSSELDDIVRLWVFHKLFLFIKSPVHAQEILKNIKFRKTDYYTTIFGKTALGQGIIFQVDTEVWRRQRRILTPTFHFKILHSYITYFYEEANVLCDTITDELTETDQIALDMKLKLSGFDMIVRNILGIHISAQKNPDHSFLLNMIKTLQIIQRRISQPWLLNDTLFRLYGYASEQKKVTQEINQFVQNIIQLKRSEIQKNKIRETYSDPKETSDQKEDNNDLQCEDSKHKSLLELLLEIGQSPDDKFTDAEILQELTTIFFAALDTTSTANVTCLLLLAMHPEVLNKVIQEIDSIFGGPGNDNGRKPTPEDLSKMTYLECVIKETSRLYPSAPLVVRTVDEETPVGKHILPKGCTILIMIASIHRNKHYYRSPVKFIPERFLPDESINGVYWRQKHPFVFIPFSAGPRNCIGQKYALLQIKTTISTILRRFTLFSNSNFQSIKDIDKHMSMDVTFRLKNGVVGVKKRS